MKTSPFLLWSLLAALLFTTAGPSHAASQLNAWQIANVLTPNEPLTIESSSDLSPDGWEPLFVSTTDAKGKREVIDSAPLSQKRFYRVKRK